ncbi:hypothetical protein EalM132_00089 [Exiguobacterium phage vB_EalM-132]|nr:hypothetical protein EalM132_00089 [Exiguobacterium phage vB_EalM-132]
MAVVASGQISLVDLNDAKSLTAYIGSNRNKVQVLDVDTGTLIPNWATSNLVLTPELYVSGSSTNIINSAKSVKWYEGATLLATGNGYTVGTASPFSLTVSQNKLSESNSALVYVCEITWTDSTVGQDLIIKTQIDFALVKNGATGSPSLTAVLTNESATIATLSDGTGGSYGSATTTMIVYSGTTNDSANYNFTHAIGPVNTNITGTFSGATFTATAMAVDSAYVDITATHKTVAGRTLTKRFNITKNKQGTAGTTPTSYWLLDGLSAIQKSVTNVLTPASFTVEARAQTGTATPIAYAGRFQIFESTDLVTWGTAKYTSSANESSRAYTISSSTIKGIKVCLYLAGATTTLLDEQIIPVVSDGATGANGANAVVLTVDTPDGVMIRNAVGTLKAKAIIYNGASLVTATAYKWYAQDLTATTSSGGDADGGNGWRLLTSTYTQNGVTGYTTAEITIPSAAILRVESFKVVATYNSVKYSGVVTMVDVSDPYEITVEGTNTFKNGQGTAVYTARVFQGGTEIDPYVEGKATNTYKFTYTWGLYNTLGNKITTALGGTGTATGKRITVSATDIPSRANLICEVAD